MKFLSSVAVILFFATSHFPSPTALAAEANRTNDSLPTPEEVSRMKPVDPQKAAALLKEVKYPDDNESAPGPCEPSLIGRLD
jgi:hypothetical protein